MFLTHPVATATRDRSIRGRRCLATLVCLSACLLDSCLAWSRGPEHVSRSGVTVSDSGPWLQFRGRPVLLAGDSITQAWFELGTDFNQEAWLDALSVRGINAVLLWSFIGVTDQIADPRIGYDSPEIWPWHRRDGRFDLTSVNDVYFERLRSLVEYADQKDIIVVITVHDGWTKTRFDGHPFNRLNGGALAGKSDYVRLGRALQEMPPDFDSQWNADEQHQFALERLCDRILAATGQKTNVVYELFNEGEWYDRPRWETFQRHFARFFRKRTRQPLMVNDDRQRGRSFRRQPDVDVLGLHLPQWGDKPSARTFFEFYAPQFSERPAKPMIFSETVPEYQGGRDPHGGILRLLWGTALAGTGVLFQNDTSWSFAPRTTMAQHIADRDTVLDFEGHVARFLNSESLALSRMKPSGEVASSGVCLSESGISYVAFFEPSDVSSTMDLTPAEGRTFKVTWFNPRTGDLKSGREVSGGGPIVFQAPWNSEAVLWLQRAR